MSDKVVRTSVWLDGHGELVTNADLQDFGYHHGDKIVVIPEEDYDRLLHDAKLWRERRREALTELIRVSEELGLYDDEGSMYELMREEYQKEEEQP